MLNNLIFDITPLEFFKTCNRPPKGVSTNAVAAAFNKGLNMGRKEAFLVTAGIFNDTDIIDLMPKIKDVKFHEPATIVFWDDGTKTVVKTQDGEPFDKEKGLAMAFIKRVFENNRCYYEMFKKYCEE